MTKENILNKLHELSTEEQKLLALKIKGFAQSGALKSKNQKPKKLVAYVNDIEVPNIDGLKTYLKSIIPEYMVPTSIKKIKKFPTLPNGKIDKSKLQSLTLKKDNEDNVPLAQKLPESDVEKKLITIWENVLGFSPIRVDDNFFEIGGDSILSIQIIAKARKEGIHLKANQLFENQTIAELSMFANSDISNIETPHVNIEGKTPLTPVQHWFFESHKNAPYYWNQIIELQNIDDVSNKTFEIIANEIISNHEALRLSFKKINNTWEASVLSINHLKYFHYFDVTELQTITSQNNKINDVLLDIQNNIKLEKGNLFKIIFFKCNNIQANRVLLIAHHLVVDFVSWNIIFNDIVSAIKNASNDYIVKANKNKTATIKDWGNYLEKLSVQKSALNELSYWNSQSNDNNALPTDFNLKSEVFLENSVFTNKKELSIEQTKDLVYSANKPYNTKVEDLLISALVTTICEWGNLNKVCLGLERQGRNADNLDVDVSNTVGWFTSFFPVLFQCNKALEIGNYIKSIKEQLRKIPNNGLSYGVLKYLTHKDTKSLKHVHPKIIFNYLGNSNTTEDNESISFKFIESPTRDSNSERNYEIEINAYIVNNKLIANFSFTKDLYNETTASLLTAKFLENLNKIINHCKAQNDISYTPSDFPEADLNQDDLDNLLSQF